jgi:hypothetical protein
MRIADFPSAILPQTAVAGEQKPPRKRVAASQRGISKASARRDVVFPGKSVAAASGLWFVSAAFGACGKRLTTSRVCW